MGIIYSWLRESELSRLNCLVPVYYDDGGNYTEVWFDNGRKEIVKNRTATVLKHLASYMGIDPRQERTPWAVGVNRRTCPIILLPRVTLVPLRLRRPRYRDQGGTGYVVLEKIVNWEETEQDGYRSVLWLAGNQKLLCLLRPETLSYRLMNADRVSRRRREMDKKLNLWIPQLPYL